MCVKVMKFDIALNKDIDYDASKYKSKFLDSVLDHDEGLKIIQQK